jgi:carboxyl-terminal processing protease
LQFDNVTWAKQDETTYIMKIRAFGTNTFSWFRDQLKEIKKDSTIENIIFDLRWNPGWIMWEAENMLDYVYPKGKLIYTVNMQKDKKDKIISTWVPEEDKKDYEIDFSKYNIYVLVDDWTASAAELFAASMKNAFPDAKIVWETSYWKASMQSVRSYRDGSTLKYTIAVWTVWEDNIEIHKTWITPDIAVEFDKKLYIENKIDSQLQAVLDNINNN